MVTESLKYCTVKFFNVCRLSLYASWHVTLCIAKDFVSAQSKMISSKGRDYSSPQSGSLEWQDIHDLHTPSLRRVIDAVCKVIIVQ